MLILEQCEMPALLQELYEDLTSKLQIMCESSRDRLHMGERGVKMAKAAIRHLKDWVQEHPFEERKAEIHFFKYIKPRFYSQLLLYQGIYILELNKPGDSRKSIQKYLKKKLRLLKHYFEENRTFYAYLRQKCSYLDETYFLRGDPEREMPIDALHLDMDPAFSTAEDYRVAEILKNELLQQYLSEELKNIQAPQGNGSNIERMTGMKWTGTLAGLYEIIYALRRAGAINNGNVTISELADFFSLHLGVNLKNIYRGHQENRLRHDRAAFLKLLVKKLEEDMDESDENPKN